MLAPEVELEVWLASLALLELEVIDLHKHHDMHEQSHSAIKSDLDLERPPWG